MIDLQRKLYKFWNSFTYEGKPIPAYVEDAVPAEASFPYFAFQVQEGDVFGKSTMICTLCCQAGNGSTVNLQRAAILDEVRRAIPPEGTEIYCDDGFITLYRNNSNFFRLEVDTTLKSVCYGRIYYEIVTYYT